MNRIHENRHRIGKCLCHKIEISGFVLKNRDHTAKCTDTLHLISKIVKLLEDREGVMLLDRSRNGARLTEAGKKFYESCQMIFQEVDQLREFVKNQNEECVGDLGVGASDNLCNYVLPEVFQKFWLQHPRVRISLFNGPSETVKNEICDGRAEIGLFFTEHAGPHFVCEKLGFVEFAVVCSSKNKMLASMKRFDPKVLNRAYYIGSRMTDYLRPYPTLDMLKSVGVTPQLFFETNSQETQKRMTLQEFGYTVLPRYMVAEEIQSGLLKRISTPKPIGTSILLARKKNRSLSKPAQVFEEFLIHHSTISMDNAFKI